MPILTSIASFVGSTLSSYFVEKGLDVLLFSEPELKDELHTVILETLENYETKYPKSNEGKKFPFYHSQRIIDELLKFRVMHADDYNPNNILAALQLEPNVIPPTIIEINNFYSLFLEKVAASEKLKKLEVKQTFDSEIFLISAKLDNLHRYIENIISSFNADLENQWINRLNAYQNTLQQFKPASALELLNDLSSSLDTSTKKPSNEILSLIEYQKGISLSFLNRKDDSAKAFIHAYKLNPSNVVFRERAALSYFKIGEITSARQMADDLIELYEFNSYAWAVKILTTDIDKLEVTFTMVPAIVKRDFTFKRLLFNTYTNNKQEGEIQILYGQGLIPTSSEYEKFPITIDTYSDHVFWINLTINEYFSNFFIGFTGTPITVNSPVRILNQLIADFLTVKKGTEIDGQTEELRFLYAYTNFLLTGEKKFALEMKQRFEKVENQDSLYVTICANALQLVNETILAIDLLESKAFENIEALSLLSFCYLKTAEIENYVRTIKKLLIATQEITDSSLSSYINIITELKRMNKLQEFATEDFVKDIHYESDQGKNLVSSTLSLLLNGPSATLMEQLNELTVFYKKDEALLSSIAIIYHLGGENHKAVKLFRTFLDTTQESRELYYYIYALYNTKKDSTELLQLLMNWRSSFHFESTFLRMELQIRFELLDYATCVEICEYYLTQIPNDEDMLVNYAFALFEENSEKSNNALAGLIPSLRDFDYKSTMNVTTISSILIKRKYFDDGIELLYRYAKSKEYPELRKQYFTACVDVSQEGEQNSGPLKELEEAVVGAFIKYELKGKVYIIELTEENIKTEFYAKFLAARKGGAVVQKQPLTQTEDVLMILRVMNKYLSLHDEILEQVSNDPYSGIGMTSITFEGSDIENLNDTFRSLFGAQGTATKINAEEQIKRYYNYEISFAHIVHGLFNGDYLGGYFHLITQKDGFASIPMISLGPSITEDARFVLDITSLAMIYQIAKEHNITFRKKFIISKYIVDSIRKQYIQQDSEIKSELSLSVTQEGITPHFIPENQKESNKSYLAGLLQWIVDNCNIEISDRVIDFLRNIEPNPDNKPFIDSILNTILLVEDKPNSILVTDDILQYIKFGLLPLNRLVSSEYIIKRLIGEEHGALIEFLKNKYLGYLPTKKQLNEEYYKKLSSQTNFYNHCLQTINLFNNPNSSIPVILHVKELALNPVLLPNQLKLDITAIFVNLLRGVDPSIRNKIEQMIMLECSLLGSKLDLIIESLKDAYSILDS